MTKITESARGEDCQVRIPGICNFDPETTIFAHLNGGGMGRKKKDLHGSYCCANCHSALDGHRKTGYTPETLELWHRQGVERTQDILEDKGLIAVV